MNEIENYLASLFASEEECLVFKLQHTFEYSPMWEDSDKDIVLEITGGPELPAHVPTSIDYFADGCMVGMTGQEHGPYRFCLHFPDARMEYVRADGTVVQSP